MARPALLVLLGIYIACICGCGSSSNNGGLSTVQIQSDRFAPKTLTVNVGASVRWLNTDNRTHKVVSGTLEPTDKPQDIGPILILSSNQFDPKSVEAMLGDTVLFSNERSLQFTLEIVNDAGEAIITRTLGPNELISIPAADFPSAGKYTYRLQGSLTFSGTLILSGIPNPDGIFASQPLPPGATFIRQFNAPGTFDYFDLNQADPDASFMTGTIVVQ